MKQKIIMLFLLFLSFGAIEKANAQCVAWAGFTYSLGTSSTGYYPLTGLEVHWASGGGGTYTVYMRQHIDFNNTLPWVAKIVNTKALQGNITGLVNKTDYDIHIVHTCIGGAIQDSYGRASTTLYYLDSAIGKYTLGMRAVSQNGKFELTVASGNLYVRELTDYGTVGYFQRHNIGENDPAVPVYVMYVPSPLNNIAVSLSPPPAYNQTGISTIEYIDVLGDGNTAYYDGADNLLKQYANTLLTIKKLPEYHGFARNGINYYFPRPLYDEHNTTYYAAGTIFLLDQAHIWNASRPVAFTARASVTMLPGFETHITGTGAFVAQPLLVAAVPPLGARPAVSTEKTDALTSAFSIYPNPSSGIVNITTSIGDVIKYIKLYDMRGVLVKECAPSTSFDISELATGMYIYNIQTQNGIHSGKVLKQ